MVPQSRHTRRSIRLDPEVYADSSQICSLTIAARGRKAIFSDPNLAQAALKILRDRSAQEGVTVHAYCIMPDHVHLVLSPADGCDLVTFVARFKNLVQRAAWRSALVGRIWQPRFWDHFLRADEDLVTTVHYVLTNPVRAGLVRDWREYPYSGSLVLGAVETAGDEPPPLRHMTPTHEDATQKELELSAGGTGGWARKGDRRWVSC